MNGTVPVEVLRGIYLGILTGVVPALIAFGFGFGFRHLTGVSIPAFAVVVLGLALAGVNGGLLALADPAITEQANSITLMTSVIVVSMLTLYAHAKGDQLGDSLPRHLSWKSLRERTVSNDVVEFMAGGDRVTVDVVGSVQDLEGYPPLPDHLRAELEAVSWRFPADLTIAELQERMADRLRSDFDLQEVSVTIDLQGRASVAAAPPSAGVSSRVPTGKRAVSISALVPTGIARGDQCTVIAADTVVQGTVVSASSTPDGQPAPAEPAEPEPVATEPQAAGDSPTEPPGTRAPTTTGGEGRITVAVPVKAAETLLAADGGRVVIESRGTHREYELLSLLRRSGQRFKRVAIESPGPFAEGPLEDAGLKEAFGVAILAHRNEGEWTMAPAGSTVIQAGDEVFAVGTGSALERFEEAVS